MIKLIRLIAGLVAFIAFVSVYSSPEMRTAIMMAIDSDYEDSYYEEENNYDGSGGDYAYDDYDSDYDY